ncbi:MAG: response regulator, partial [Mariniphaga sp.]|nr:response regulator [Mariniphaga sp.]
MKTIHILLVEDNFLHLKLIKKMLGTDSKKIVAVSTLKECIDQLNTNNFDVVLLDLNLPDSKGKDTFRDVHEYRKDLPIILITGSEDENFALELIREGAQDYITKQRLSPEILSRSIYYSIERQALLQDVIEQKERIQSIEQERTIIQQALIHSRENFYRSVAESPLGIRIVTDDGETIYANKAILDIYGFDNIEEFKRTSVKDRYTPESYKEYLQRRCCRKNGE